MRILAADLGATNSRFAVFSEGEDRRLQIGPIKRFDSNDGKGLDERLCLLRDPQCGIAHDGADIAVFACAGLVEQGVLARHREDWEAYLGKIQQALGVSCCVFINDFVAQAYACLTVLGKHATLMIGGEPVSRSPVAVIGAGTGLGKAAILCDRDERRLIVASEGSHSNFCPETKEEFDFQQWLCEQLGGRYNYVPWYKVVSGPGLSWIHQFLTNSKTHLDPSEVAATFNVDSPTLQWASRLYGRVARNYCLEVLAQGGLYIVGGVVAKNPCLISHPAFREAFYDSRWHHDLLKRIPVSVITDEASGLWGAAYYGLSELRRSSGESVEGQI